MARAQTSSLFRIFNAPDPMAKPHSGIFADGGSQTRGRSSTFAGQVALDRAGNLVGKGDFRAQVQQAFENLKAAVEAAGGDFHNAIKRNYYCAESVGPAQVPAVRGIRNQ